MNDDDPGAALRRERKETAVQEETVIRYQTHRTEMLAAFAGLSDERKLRELRVLIVRLGEKL